MDFAKLNKSNVKLFTVEVENPVFRKLKTFEVGEVLKVLGCYKNTKSVFGDEPIFIVENIEHKIFFVNMPKQHLETIDNIIKDKELIDGINKGLCYIEVVKYYSKKYKKECFNFNFIDVIKKNTSTDNVPTDNVPTEKETEKETTIIF